MGTLFKALNRNKQSVTVDLADPDARARLRRLIVEEADVLVQNMRAGHAEKLGFGAEDLLRDNPRLIHASIAAFGTTGPLSQRPGYDPLMQAFGGLMGVTGEPGRPPVRIGTSPIDMGAGMWVVIGVLSALLKRAPDRQGWGRRHLAIRNSAWLDVLSHHGPSSGPATSLSLRAPARPLSCLMARSVRRTAC